MKKILAIGASGFVGSHAAQLFNGTAEVIEASFGSDTMPVDITDRESLAALMRAAAVELPPTVRVNAVSPGWVAETMVAMGMDPAPSMPAAEVALHFVRQANFGETGTVLVAARQ